MSFFNSFGRDQIPKNEPIKGNFRNSYFLAEHLSSPVSGILLPPVILGAIGYCLVKGFINFFKSKSPKIIR